MNLGSRIRQLRKLMGINQTQLAARAGISTGALHALEKRDSIRTGFDRQIAEALGLTLDQLRDPAYMPAIKAGSTVERIPSGNGVPLISWITAGAWNTVSDPFQPGDAEEWLPCPTRHGPRAYCLRVRGDSMYNPAGNGPSYSNGDIIFVDPDRAANHGDRVIVRLDDQHEATFKQLVVEDGRKLLKALNPEWRPRYIEVDGAATITGVVIGKWVPE